MLKHTTPPTHRSKRSFKTAAIIAQLELVRLVERVKEGLGSNGHGAAGFNEVADGLERGQVRTMVVDRNYRPPGWTCTDCDWVGLTQLGKCPRCGGRPVPVLDSVPTPSHT